MPAEHMWHDESDPEGMLPEEIHDQHQDLDDEEETEDDE